jgi:GNAT superfamily N-acetyltransferase
MYYPHGYSREQAMEICDNKGTDVEYLVVIANEEVVAFGFIRTSKETFGMAVVDEFQRKGIGSIFVDFLLYYARSKGFKKLATESGTFKEGHLKDILSKKGFNITNEFLTYGRPTLMMEQNLEKNTNV